MSYQLLPFRQSPNYTPAGQTRAFYGRDPVRAEGAGHWWDAPENFPSFSGVVNTLMNPARQCSAHDVVGDGIVQPLVRREDTSWATGSANPYTYSIETDPQIIYRWRAGGDKAKANRIFETLCERIADVSMHDKVWRPHKFWMTTGCNPIEWGDVMNHAKEIWQSKYGQPAQPAEWKKNLKQIPDQTLLIKRDGAPLRNLANVSQQVKTYSKGTPMLISAETRVGNYRYLLTQYAFLNNTGQGFDEYELEAQAPPQPVVPEWQKNLRDITPVKLTVLVTQTPIVNLNDLSVIKQLGSGTQVDFTKATTVAGKEYLISSYSATNAMPNGILKSDVGVPAQPPVNEKPEWLKNWQDIADVDMYARADTDLVNLDNGLTIQVIPRGTKVRIASTTEWHGQKYAISEYSTSKNIGNGIRIDDLDMKPINTDPITPSPTQPTIEENVNWLVKAVKAILAKLGINI